MQIYEKVRDYIDTNHLKQKSVAECAGIPNVMFSAMLSGKRKMYAEDLKAICLALGVPASTFIEQQSA